MLRLRGYGSKLQVTKPHAAAQPKQLNVFIEAGREPNRVIKMKASHAHLQSRVLRSVESF
jgi:hypothetical protein